jgi:uncharacterized RDD family membrane protein YckC
MTDTPDSLSPDAALSADVRYAGFWIRVGAALVDLLVTVPIFVVFLFIPSPAVFLLGIILLLAYKPVMEGSFGATLGKMALGLRVVDKAFVKIGPTSALIRAAIFIVSSVPSYFTYYKMKVAGIALTDVEALQAFQAANKSLQYMGNALSVVALVACVWVAFNARKRGLHDMLADSFVVYKESLPRH